MQAILLVTVPFFALVGLGLLAARTGLLPLDAVPGLQAFVVRFALPCLLFRLAMALPLRQLLDPVVVAVYLLGALTLVVFVVARTLAPRRQLKDAAFGALVTACPEIGLLGVALLAALAGTAAVGPVLVALLCDAFVTTSLCLALAQSRQELPRLPVIGPGHGAIGARPPGDEDEAPGAPGRLRTALGLLRVAASQPLPWAIVLGVACGGLGLPLPAVLERIVALLADAAAPLALFTLGALPWRARVQARELAEAEGLGLLAGEHLPLRQGGGRLAAMTSMTATGEAMAGLAPSAWQALRPDLGLVLVKLLLHPLLVLLLGLAARALGAPLASPTLAVLVLVAALPGSSSALLLAERQHADAGRIARIVMATTVLSFVSISLIAWALGLPARLPGAG